MGKKRRRSKDVERRRGTSDSESDGSGSFVEDVGLFEAANGFPHGPTAIVLAIVAAIVIYPIGRFIRFVTRR
jgi:hypothetical protein